MLSNPKTIINFVLLLLAASNLVRPEASGVLEQKIPLAKTYANVSQPSHIHKLEVNLSRRRVNVYRGGNLIKSYPIAVGRPNWETPTGNFQVLQLLQKPKWINPMTGKSIPGGTPGNPLGKYWIGFWTDGRNWVGFHGTPNPETVGTAASHGCLRMYNKDIEELFKVVSLGTPVTVVK
ncbi:ErfK/YbiS/YcfS/YnhG family protein [Calothrix sp. PCC 7716]|nr:ErfK/YbiS/YcfS/YnhG family protein [Calothrix sp. PCC 7716]